MSGKGSDKAGNEQAAKAAKTKLDNVLLEIDKDLLKKLFNYFEVDQNASLVAGIECFVALLRGTRTATNVDIELYLTDYDKLIFKLKRCDVSKLTMTVIEHLKGKLTSVSPAFEQSSHPDYAVCAQYQPFLKWSQVFCEYAELQLIVNADKQGSDLLQVEHDNAVSRQA